MKLSRRNVLIGGLAVPVAGQIAPVPVHPIEIAPSGECSLLARAAEWASADERLTSMQLQWQDYESAVFDKARRMKISCARACESNWPEAQAMRALDLQITAAYAQLEALAGQIRRMRATTISGAVAKIQLGLKVQGPYDWQDHAYELVEDGLVELRKLTGLV